MELSTSTVVVNTQWRRKGGDRGGPPRAALLGGWQNRDFGIDEMVCKKVLKGTENFWESRSIFRMVVGKLLG